MYYYIEQNNKPVLVDTDRTRLLTTLKYTPQYKGLVVKSSDVEISVYTEDELALRKVDEQGFALDEKVSKLKEDLVTAQLTNNTEWITSIQAEYATLMEL